MMRKKPYYDPKTKETYRYITIDGMKFKFYTGAAWRVKYPGIYKMWRNELGDDIRRERSVSYVPICTKDKDRPNRRAGRKQKR